MSLSSAADTAASFVAELLRVVVVAVVAERTAIYPQNAED